MTTLKHIAIAAVTTLTLISCGGGSSDQPHTAEGFTVIENELKDKFGDDAYYTNIYISHDEQIGNMISLTVTEAPESLKMGQWNLAQNAWTQTSEVTLEIPEGSKATDFMFQLDDKINLTKIGELIEKSREQLKAEKDIENPSLFSALINFPKNGDINDAEYSIGLKPENGGTTFHFYYKLNGELRKMDY